MNELFNRINNLEGIIDQIQNDLKYLNQIEIMPASDVDISLPLTTKGDILSRTSTTNVRLAVGSNGRVLMANSATSTGLEWATLPSSPLTTKGDIYTRNASSDARLGVGSDGQVLSAQSGNPNGLAWIDYSPFSTPLTTKGDIYVRNASGDTRLAIGEDNRFLKANSATATGLDWSELPTSPLVLKGDIYVRNATSDARHPIGSNGQILSANSATPNGIQWIDSPLSVLTTAGDILAHNGTSPAKMDIGSEGQVLTVFPGNPNKLLWSNPADMALTTKGDILAHTGFSDVKARVPVGTDGQVLVANSATTTGLDWYTLPEPTPYTSPLTTKGDIFARSASGDIRFPVSEIDGLVLKTNSATLSGLSWEEQTLPPIMTTKGDILTHSAIGPDREPIGSDGQILSANSSMTNGLEWKDYSPLTHKGDIYTRDASGEARLPVNITNGKILKTNSSTATGLEWGDLPTRPLTTKGDIWIRDNLGDERLPVGTNNQVLIADSTTDEGLRWATKTSLNDISAVAGNMVYFNGTNWIAVSNGDEQDELTLTSNVPTWGQPTLVKADGGVIVTPDKTGFFFDTTGKDLVLYDKLTDVQHRVITEDENGYFELTQEPYLSQHPTTKNYVDSSIDIGLTEFADEYFPEDVLHFTNIASSEIAPPASARYKMQQTLASPPSSVVFNSNTTGEVYVGAFFDETVARIVPIGTHNVKFRAVRQLTAAATCHLRLDLCKRVGGVDTLIHTGETYLLTGTYQTCSYDIDIDENIGFESGDGLFFRVYITLNIGTSTNVEIDVNYTPTFDSTNFAGMRFNSTPELALGIPTENDSILVSSNAGTRRWVTFYSKIKSLLGSLSAKTTPVSADKFPIIDSADSDNVKTVTYANLLSTLSTAIGSGYFLLNSGLTRIVQGVGEVRFSSTASFARLFGATWNADLTGYMSYLLIPRWSRKDKVIFEDYQDALAFADKWATSAIFSTNPNISSGSTWIDPLFRDDNSEVEWNAGTPFPLAITLDLTDKPIQTASYPYVKLGFTTRSGGLGGVPLTNVLIEFWDEVLADWVEMFNDAPTASFNNQTSQGGYFISPTLTTLENNNYEITKLRVTISGDNGSIANKFRLVRLALYQQDGAWDTFHVHKGGDTMYGPLKVAITTGNVAGIEVDSHDYYNSEPAIKSNTTYVTAVEGNSTNASGLAGYSNNGNGVVGNGGSNGVFGFSEYGNGVVGQSTNSAGGNFRTITGNYHATFFNQSAIKAVDGTLTFTGAGASASRDAQRNELAFNEVATKSVPVDADNILITDSADSYKLKKTLLGSILSKGIDFGYSIFSSVVTSRLKGILIPRRAFFDQISFGDYTDTAAYWDTFADSISISPPQDSGLSLSLFRDNSNGIAWTTGTPFPITITVDSSTSPIPVPYSDGWQCGITFLSGGVTITNIKIEIWDGTTYQTVFDAPPGVHGEDTNLYGYFLSPRFGSYPAIGYSIEKLRVTIDGNNAQIGNYFSIARLSVFNSSAEWNPWHVRKDGGKMYGPLLVPDDNYDSSWNGLLEVPTKNAVYDKIEATLLRATILPFHSESDGTVGLTNQTNAESFLASSNRNITKFDLTQYTQVRLITRVTTGSSSVNNPRLRVRYSTTFSTTVGDYSNLGVSEVSTSLTSTGIVDSGWVNLTAGALDDVFVTITQLGGDGIADPAFGMVMVHFR